MSFLEHKSEERRSPKTGLESLVYPHGGVRVGQAAREDSRLVSWSDDTN